MNHLQLKPYPATLQLSFNEEKLKPNSLAETALEDDGTIVVVVRLNVDKLSLRRTLVHESTHVVQFIEDYIESTLDDESFAYMVETVADWLWRKCGVDNDK